MTIPTDDKVVKKIGDKLDVPLTEEQAKEWIKCANDKYYFFENYCYIEAPKGRAKFVPREYQRRIIDTSTDNRMAVSLLGRQSGKCIGKDTKYTVRSKVTGEIYEITAEEFHEQLEREVSRYC